LSGAFDGVELVPLLFEGEHYPSVVDYIQMSEDYIFIVDKDARMHVFKPDGHYVSSSNDKFGVGPGEFSVAMGCSWNPYSQLIEIITQGEIKFYDIDFNYKGACALPGMDVATVYEQIYDESATTHFLIPTGISKNPYRIVRYNSETGEVMDELNYEDDVIAPMSMQLKSFYRMPDGKLLFAAPAVTTGIFSLDNNDAKLKKIIGIDLGDSGITKGEVESHDADKAELAKYLMTCSRIIPLKTMVSSSRIFITYKKGTTLNDFYTVLINRENGDISSFKLYTDGTYLFPQIEYVDSDYAYAVMEKEEIKANPSLLLSNALQADSLLSTVEAESLVLMKYRFARK